jgi:chromosome segregation ATPase
MLFSTLALASCTTTGDPSSGGLLGWSEKKAISRQVDLEKKRNNAAKENAELLRQTRSKEDRKAALQTSIDQENQDFESLLVENQGLERQMTELLSQKDNANEEFSKLKEKLSKFESSDELNRSYRDSTSEVGKNSYLNRLKQVNEFYTKTIIFLLDY